MMKKRIAVCAIIGTLCVLVLFMCSKKKNPVPENSKELLYLLSDNYALRQLNKNMNDTEFAQELRRRTGINVRFAHPAHDDMKSELMKRLASSNMPDIIEMSWEESGGPEKALEDEIIIPLNEVIKKYSPSFQKYIDENPENIKSFMTDSGVFYAYPFIREEEYQKKYQGPVLRGDWLDELGLAVPETVDEWEKVLREFKNKKGADAPAALKYADFAKGMISGAYGVSTGYFNDNGVIRFGPYEEGFRAFLEKMAAWYSEGLIDKSFMSMTTESAEEKLISGNSGAAFMIIGSGIGKLEQSRDRQSPKLTAAQYPVLKKGDELKFGAYDNGQCNAAISSSCRDVPLAARFLDYGYSREGMLTYNFGIENVSYVIEDGKPKYTALITDNPDYIMQIIMSNYIRGNYNGPFIQIGDYLDQYFVSSVQKRASELWTKVESEKTAMPRITYTGEEKEDMIKYDEIERYANDMIKKMIAGIRPVSEFDDFRKELESMGLKQAISIKQKAYERYLKRGE